jgi:hypothetical protein
MYPVALSSLEVLLKTDAMPCFKTLFFHHVLLWLAQVYVSHVFLTSGLDGFSHLSNMHLATLTWGVIATFRYSLSFIGLSMQMLFFTGMWMVLMFYLARSVLMLFKTTCWSGIIAMSPGFFCV